MNIFQNRFALRRVVLVFGAAALVLSISATSVADDAASPQQRGGESGEAVPTDAQAQVQFSADNIRIAVPQAVVPGATTVGGYTGFETQYAPWTDPATGRVYMRARTNGAITYDPKQFIVPNNHLAIGNLVQQIRFNPDEQAKTAQRAELAKALAAEFDEMHGKQAEQITSLKARLDKAQSFHEQRLVNKEKIIDRRMEQLLGTPPELQWNTESPGENSPTWQGYGSLAPTEYAPPNAFPRTASPQPPTSGRTQSPDVRSMPSIQQRYDQVPQLRFESSPVPVDPFGGAANPFGGAADPFGDVADPFGSGYNPFGPEETSLASSLLVRAERQYLEISRAMEALQQRLSALQNTSLSRPPELSVQEEIKRLVQFIAASRRKLESEKQSVESALKKAQKELDEATEIEARVDKKSAEGALAKVRLELAKVQLQHAKTLAELIEKSLKATVNSELNTASP